MNRKREALLTLYSCIAVILVMIIIALTVSGVGSKVSPNEEAGEHSEQGVLLITPEPTPIPRTDPTIHMRLEPAPEDYFDDALFLGNSVAEGLAIYDYDGLLDNASFVTKDGVNLLNAAELLSELDDKIYGKIYIELGTNEMSYDLDQLRVCYEDLVDALEERYPGSVIYLMAVPPVSRYKSNNNAAFTKALAVKFNEMIMEIALEKNLWYLDVYTALADEDGYLPSEVTVDGIHFTPGHYELWYNCLRYSYDTQPPLPQSDAKQ